MDQYVVLFTTWAENQWYWGVAAGALGVVIVVVMGSVAIHKSRMRAHARVPHYRRRR
jgi:hypothetical protein